MKYFFLVGLLFLCSCTNLDTKIGDLQRKNNANIETSQKALNQPIPVVSSSDSLWLAGTVLKIAEPISPILKQSVSYHPTRAVTLADVASWITQNTGLIVETSELQQSPMGVQQPVATSPTLSPQQQAIRQTVFNMFVNYDGALSGLLDVLANKASAWWKMKDGKVRFYQLATRTFYLPALAREFSEKSTITSSSGSSSDGSSNTSSNSNGSGTQTTNTGSNSSGSAQSISRYTIEFWADIEKTAKTVSAGGQVSVNKSAASITVTGTPTQVGYVEEWAKNLADQLSQQVAITVHIYNIKLANEDNYGLNPTVIFKSISGGHNFSITGGSALPTTGNITPFKLTSSVSSGQYTGTQIAFQALSTLGNVTEQFNQTVVTLNGQPAPIQLATQTGYLASTATTLTLNVGATTTLTPGIITAGITAMFLPRIVNGKVILGMNMTNSVLNGFTTATSGGASIQTPNVDSYTFQQSVSLTPGDALLLTGLQHDYGGINKQGVGMPDNFLLGGGVNNKLSKQLIAIVITARIL